MRITLNGPSRIRSSAYVVQIPRQEAGCLTVEKECVVLRLSGAQAKKALSRPEAYNTLEGLRFERSKISLEFRHGGAAELTVPFDISGGDPALWPLPGKEGPLFRPALFPPDHVCGAAGFGKGLADTCSACELHLTDEKLKAYGNI